MTHGSLFNGIGGFQLAASWMGWENVFSCEIDDFCNKVTKYHFPNCIQYGDIKTTDFSIWRGKIDIITGGFPCQPYSNAGKRKGKADERHLWPEMLRAIREIQPRWVVGENVPGLLNWERGMVLDEIKADLEAAGFEVFPPLVLPACGKNAPHRRDRLWVVAYSEGNIGNDENRNEEPIAQEVSQKRFNEFGITANTNSNGLNGSNSKHEINASEGGVDALGNIVKGIDNGITANTKCIRQPGQGWAEGQVRTTENGHWKASWADDDGGWPTQPPVCGGNDGIPDRIHRIKALGNAVVPQIVFEIFKAIDEN